MLRLLVIVYVLVARPAHAGMCDVEGVRAMVEEIELLAVQAKPKPRTTHTYGICMRDALPDAAKTKLRDRMLAACTKLLAKAPDDAVCVEIAARLGKAELDGHDIVATIAARPNRLDDALPIELLGMTVAPRVAPIVIARWKELQPIADKKQRDNDAMQSWAVWRTTAAIALGKTGDAAAKAFLADQAKATIDRGVRRACDAAISAIAKRIAAP